MKSRFPPIKFYNIDSWFEAGQVEILFDNTDDMQNIDRSVIMAQLAERSFPIPEDRDSISFNNFLIDHYFTGNY